MDYTPITQLEQLLQAEIEARRNAKPGTVTTPDIALGDIPNTIPTYHYQGMPFRTPDNNKNVEICNYNYSDKVEETPIFNKVREETEAVIKKTCAGTQPLLKINVSGLSDVHNLQYGYLIPYSLISDLYYKKACMEDYIGRLEDRITQLETNTKAPCMDGCMDERT